MIWTYRVQYYVVGVLCAFVICTTLSGDEVQVRIRETYLHNYMGLRKDLEDDNLLADRRLAVEDIANVLHFADVVLDREENLPKRIKYARFLGRIGHAYCLPALSSILHDESEEENVRRACASALFGIRDARRIDIAISQLHEENINVWYEVAWILKDVKGPDRNPRPKIIEFPKVAAERRAYQAKWRDWWSVMRQEVALPSRYSQGMNPYTNGLPSPMPYFGE